MKHTLRFVAFAFFILYNIINVRAQNWNSIIKLAAADRQSSTISGRGVGDSFGKAVAISGEYAIVGVIHERDDSEGKNNMELPGAAYIFKMIDGNWKKIKKICASDRSNLGYFGFSVAITDGYAAVTTCGPGSSAVYVFKSDEGGADNWGQVQQMQPPYSDTRTGFGSSVSISGDYIVVGAPYDSRDALEQYGKNDAGSAYVYKKNFGGTNNWGQIKKLTAVVPNVYDIFGFSVAISGANIIIGAPGDKLDGEQANPLYNAGSAYIFAVDQNGSDNWGFIKRVVSPDRFGYGQFGSSVAISGNRLIVGAYGEGVESSGTRSYEVGAAYIFRKIDDEPANWGLEKRLTAPSRKADDRFGFSVAISGDQVIVGADQQDADDSESNVVWNAGAAYIFREGKNGAGNWGMAKKVVAYTRHAFDLLGYSVSISGDNALVGAWGDDEDEMGENPVPEAGSVFSFSKDRNGVENWGGRLKITASDRAGGWELYGESVAISGQFAVVGAPGETKDANGLNAILTGPPGAAYILYNNAGKWEQVNKICAPARYQGDLFGSSVAIYGDYVVVGAKHNSYGSSEENYVSRSGAVYIYKKDQGGSNNWGLVKKLTTNNRKADDLFGQTISIYGSYIVVGAPGEDEDSNEAGFMEDAGAAYVFKNSGTTGDNWIQIKKLTASDRSSFDFFGYSVAINGTNIIVGSTWDDDGVSANNYLDGAGSAFIFEKERGGSDNWGQAQKITSAVRTPGSAFGNKVAIDKDYAIVSPFNDNRDESELNYLQGSGAVFLFKKTSSGSWIQIKKICAPVRYQGDQFGYSISINQDFVLVGAPYGDEFNVDDMQGTAYLFKKDLGGTDSWGFAQKFSRTRGSRKADHFGGSVSLGGKYAIVGVPWQDEDATDNNTIVNSGAVIIFNNYDATSLPVTLISFSATKIEQHSLLEWRVAEEKNSGYYAIERSADGNKWKTLGGQITAKGSGSNYTYIDNVPLQEQNYYRLKMVDIDNSFAYSQIRNLSFNTKEELFTYPNPVSEKLYVHPSVDLSEIGSIRIFNSRGQKVIHSQTNIRDGISVADLPKGLYTVQIEKINGSKKFQQVLIAR